MSRSFRATAVAATVLTTCLTALTASPASADGAAPALTLDTARYLGGSGNEWPRSPAVAPDGSAYLALTVEGGGFPGAGAGHGGEDIVVAKLTPDLSSVSWATAVGGSGADWASTVEIGVNGEVVVAGGTSSADFPTTVGALKATGDGSEDGVVLRLDPVNGAVLWSTRIGGSASEQVGGLAVGPDGTAWVVGSSTSTDFPVTPGADGSNAGGGDAFLTGIGGAGTLLRYSTLAGSPSSNSFSAVALGPGQRLWVAGSMAGWTSGAPTTFLGAEGAQDPAVVRFAIDGFASHIEHTTHIGSVGTDLGQELAVDAQGSAFLATEATNPGLVTVNPFQATFPTDANSGLLVKLSPSGEQVEWSTFFGSGVRVFPQDIVLDAWGSAHVTGSTSSGTFPAQHAIKGPVSDAAGDAFLLKVTGAGRLVYSTLLGGAGRDGGTGITLASDGAPLVAVATDSDFPMPAGSADATYGGMDEAVLARFGSQATVHGLTGPTGPTADATPTWAFGTDYVGARTECRIDAAAWAPCAGTWTAAALATGSHTVQVRALDRPGHAGPVVSATVQVDVTAPQSRITKHPRKRTQKATARFRFAAEPGATLSCKVDKRPWRACRARFAVKVKPGKHVLRVRATDALGNTDTTPAVFRWKRR